MGGYIRCSDPSISPSRHDLAWQDIDPLSYTVLADSVLSSSVAKRNHHREGELRKEEEEEKCNQSLWHLYRLSHLDASDTFNIKWKLHARWAGGRKGKEAKILDHVSPGCLFHSVSESVRYVSN